MLCNGCMQDLVCVRRPFYHEAASRDGFGKVFPGIYFLEKDASRARSQQGSSHIPAALVSQPFWIQPAGGARTPRSSGCRVPKAPLCCCLPRWEMTSRCLFCCSNPFFSAKKGKRMNCLELTGSQQLRSVSPPQQVEENERSHCWHPLASECSMRHIVCITCVFLQKN